MLFTLPSTKLLNQFKQITTVPTKISLLPSHQEGGTNPPHHNQPSLSNSLASLGFFLLLFLTPLIFTPLTSELFEFPKMVFVYAITIYELSLYVWQCWRRKTIIVPQTPLTKPIIFYLGGLLLTTIFSINLYTSIAGYYTRFNGSLISTFAYIILFYLFLAHLAESRHVGTSARQTENANTNWPASMDIPAPLEEPYQKETEQNPSVPTHQRVDVPTHRNLQFLWAWLLSASAVSIYGILEHFGHDPSCLVLRGTFTANCWVEDVSARVFATFGQPNWLATYLVATLPLGLALLVSTTNRQLKTLAWVSTLLCYAAFWYTYSRSAWFGLIAALGVFLLVLINFYRIPAWLPFITQSARRHVGTSSSKNNQERLDEPTRRLLYSRNLWFLATLLLACTIVSLSSFHMAASRATSTLESGAEDSSTGQIRLLVWQGTLGLIKDHPIIGTGPQTFAYMFLPYRPRAMNDTTEWNFLYNEAHNQLLNQLATTGLLGTIPWLALYVYALLLALNLNPVRFIHYILSRQSGVKNGQEISKQTSPLTPTPYSLHPTTIPAALAAGIIGAFVSQLFGFSVVVTDLLFWLALAFLAAPTTNLQTTSLGKLKTQKTVIPNLFFFLSAFLILLAASALFAYTSAEILASRASANLLAGNLTAAVTQGQQAIFLNPFEPTYHKDLAYTDAYIASLSQSDTYTTNQAVTQAKIAYQLNPYDQLITKGLITVYQTLAYTDPKYNQQVLAMAHHSLDLAPTDAASAQALAELQLSQNQKDDAYHTLQTLITLRPYAGDSYYRLALYYAKYGPVDKEKQALGQALKIDPNLQQAKDLLNNSNQLKTLPGDD